tara:strand:- start:436 stop:690 length:255 start_codon:yes stop_codon:yes gene_type:complete
MTVLGGHQPHSDKTDDIHKKGLNKTYVEYAMSDDIAYQLKNAEIIRSYCKLDDNYFKKEKKKSFYGHFKSVLSKWLNKQSVEID